MQKSLLASFFLGSFLSTACGNGANGSPSTGGTGGDATNGGSSNAGDGGTPGTVGGSSANEDGGTSAGGGTDGNAGTSGAGGGDPAEGGAGGTASGGTASGGGTGSSGDDAGGAGNSDDLCVEGCTATLEADCDNGPDSREQCESNCRTLNMGACATEYGSLQECARGEEITCGEEGFPVILACEEEQDVFIECINQ